MLTRMGCLKTYCTEKSQSMQNYTNLQVMNARLDLQKLGYKMQLDCSYDVHAVTENG